MEKIPVPLIRNSSRARKKARSLFGATLAVSMLFVSNACQKAGTAVEPSVQVFVTEVIQKDVPIYSTWVGTTVGFVNAQIRPQVQGFLLKQAYKDGDFVKTGQLLFQIDDREYKAAFDQALGNLAQQEALLKKNQLDVARLTPLETRGAASKEELDDAVQSTLGSEAQVQTAKAAVETARLNLEWTKVQSPIDGIAEIAPVQVGDLVNPSTLLTTVSQLDPIKVTFPISEQEYLRFAGQIKEHAETGPVGYQAEAARQREFIPPIFGPVPNSPFNAFLGAINVTWEIDVWGRIRRSTEAARASFLASEEARRGVMLTLVSDVATAYFQLIELDRELEIARESAETYTNTLDLFTRRYVGGTDTKLSTSRAEAALDASAATIATLRRQITQQENALSVLLGKHPEPIPRGTALVEQSMPDMPPGLPSDLLQRRPDILQAEETMINANAEIGVAIANFFPTIGLTALYGGEAGTIGNVFKNGFSVWNIVGNMSGPIFQGGKLLEQYEAQKAFWDEMIAQYQETVVQAFREVSDALTAESELVGERVAREKQVAALKEAVELSLLRYRGGRATYLDVLDAEQQLYPAEDTLAQIQRDQLSAVVTLYKALGGGWKLSDTEWSEPH